MLTKLKKELKSNKITENIQFKSFLCRRNVGLSLNNHDESHALKFIINSITGNLSNHLTIFYLPIFTRKFNVLYS